MSDETVGENVDLPDFANEPPAEEAAPAATEGSTDEAAPDAPATDDDAPEDDAGGQRTASDLEAVFDVPVNIAAVLGGTHMEVSDLLKLNEGDVVELDRKVGEAIDLFINNRLVARGEVVLIEDRLGVTMTEIIKSEKN